MNFIYYNHSYILACPEIPLEGNVRFNDIRKKYVLGNNMGGGICIIHNGL